MSNLPVSLATVSDVIPTTLVTPPVDYTSRDYQSIVNDLVNLIPSYLPEWTDRSPGDFGIVLLELFAYMGDILNYYSDRIANESFISTAQQRQSVLNLANLLDYTPHNNVAAGVMLLFTLNQPSPNPVLIPAPQSTGGPTQIGTSLTNQPVVFEVSQDTWLYGDGIVIPHAFTGTGTPNQQYVMGANNDGYPWPTYLFSGGGSNQVVVVGATQNADGTITGGTQYTYAPGNTLAGQAAGATMYVVLNGNTIAFGGGTTGSPGNPPASGALIYIWYSTTALTVTTPTSGQPWQTPTPATQYSGPAPAIQGQTIAGEQLAVSDGSPSQQYTLFNTPVVDGSLSPPGGGGVFVDEGNGPVNWNYHQRMIDAFSDEGAWTSTVDANGVVTIIFGDGIAGRIPPASSFISATYMIGGGVIGNVAPGSLTEIIQGPSSIASVTNPEAAAGGADIETLDHIRIHAPLSITAINRAVSLDDYAALVLNYDTVAKASAMSTAYNAVNAYIHPTGDFFAHGNDTTGVAALVNRVTALAPLITNSSMTGWLDDKKMVGVSVVILPPQYFNQVSQKLSPGYVPVNVTAAVQVLPNYHQQTVKSSVQAAIQNLFLFAVVDFGYDISLASVYHACMSQEGVDWVNITGLYRNEYSSGLGDPVAGGGYTSWINCAPYEIPQAFQINVTATGGITY
jgi:hypothetical protein